MTVVKLSSKFQVVIPKEIREKMDLRPGNRIQVIQDGDCIQLVRARPITWYRGFLKGIDTDVPRDEDRI